MKGAICAGGKPSVTSGVANFASRAAITTSQHAARPQPPPIAAPSTTAIVATLSARNCSSIAPKWRLPIAIGSSSPSAGAALAIARWKPLKSPPAQKWPPLPRITRARASGAASASVHASARPATIASVSALRVAGACSVACTNAPRCSMRIIGRSWLSSRRERVHVLGDDAEHHLVGAACDRREAAVAVQARDAVVPSVAHAAPVLHAAVGHDAQQPARLELGHRGPLRHVLSGDVLLGREVDERAQRLDLRLQLGELEMDDLVVEHAPAEDLPLARVGRRLLDAVEQTLDRVRRGPQALLLELHHLVGEAHAFLADAVALRHAHAVEVDQAGVAGHHADLADLLRAFDPGRVHRHHDQALVLVRRAERTPPGRSFAATAPRGG